MNNILYKNIKLSLILAITAFIIPSGNALNAQDNNQNQTEEIYTPYTMGEWADLSKKERQLIIIGAIEALFLAATQSNEPAIAISTECLVFNSPANIEKEMKKIANDVSDLPFTDVFLVITSCAAGRG